MSNPAIVNAGDISAVRDFIRRSGGLPDEDTHEAAAIFLTRRISGRLPEVSTGVPSEAAQHAGIAAFYDYLDPRPAQHAGPWPYTPAEITNALLECVNAALAAGAGTPDEPSQAEIDAVVRVMEDEHGMLPTDSTRLQVLRSIARKYLLAARASSTRRRET